MMIVLALLWAVPFLGAVVPSVGRWLHSNYLHVSTWAAGLRSKSDTRSN